MSRNLFEISEVTADRSLYVDQFLKEEKLQGVKLNDSLNCEIQKTSLQKYRFL